MNGWFFLVTVSIPLLLGSLLAMGETVIRRDLGLGRKAGWIAALWLVPLIGLAAYILVRPHRQTRFRTRGAGRPSDAAVALVALAEGLQRGAVDGATYDADVTRFLPPADPADQRVS